MVKRTLAERFGDVKECAEYAGFLGRIWDGKAVNHRILDHVEQFHENGHASDVETPRPSKKRSASASRVVTAPPSSATEETHKFQSIFVKVVEDYLPYNDKLDPRQPVVVNEAVTKVVLKRAASSRCCFRPTKVYGEEQARPTVSALVEGIVSLIAGDEQACIARECPVRYFVKSIDEDGKEIMTEVSPPGEDARAQHELLSKALSHDDRKGKAWKKDFVLSSLVKVFDEDGLEKRVWVPRIHVEAKGDAAWAEDLYQASTSGWKLQLKRLQENEVIGRLYIEVWGTFYRSYGIQDIFGYVTVDRGVVMPESFALYQQTVENYRVKWGNAFPEESLARCPRTLSEMQALYDRVAREYFNKWKQPLPSTKTMEDFPVGVVYFNRKFQAFPCGHLEVSLKEAARFVQGHIRILAGNWAIPRDPAAYEAANARLLENYRRFEENKVEAELNEMLGIHQGPEKELPERVIFRSWAEAGVTQLIGEAGVTQLVGEAGASQLVGEVGASAVNNGEASSSSAGNILKNPPSREVLRDWTKDDVKRLVLAACEGESDAVMDNKALAASQVDGSILLRMGSADLGAWFTEICLQRVVPKMRIKNWLYSVREGSEI